MLDAEPTPAPSVQSSLAPSATLQRGTPAPTRQGTPTQMGPPPRRRHLREESQLEIEYNERQERNRRLREEIELLQRMDQAKNDEAELERELAELQQRLRRK